MGKDTRGYVMSASIVVDGEEVGTSSNLEFDMVEATEVSSPESSAAIPAKFRGKSVDEIVQSYTELEKELGRKGNELGELRKLSDTLIQSFNAKPNNNATQQSTQTVTTETVTDDDILENPSVNIRKLINEAIKPLAETLQTTYKQTALGELEKKHGDYREIVVDPEFQSWVTASPARTSMWSDANAGSIEMADELFTWYKSRVVPEGKSSKVAAQKTEELQAATALSTGTSQESGTVKKKYRRADIINLQITNPKRYMELQPEIMQAYREGRIV